MPVTEAESHSQAPPPNTTTTPGKSNLRKAREPNNSENVYIKNVKEVDLLTLKCMQPDINDIYFVRLKSDDEGGSKETRQKHINEIFGLCCTHSRDAAGNEFDGIEVRFEEAMPAYSGHFNPVVVKEIEARKKDIVMSVNKSYRMTMCGKRPSRNWGTAKISLEKDQWDKMPEPSTDKFKCGGDKTVYRYDYGESLGKGITIYVIDEGGFQERDFVGVESARVKVNEGYGWEVFNTPEGHGTIVTSIAAGETCGIAPEADVWVWSPSILSYVHLIAALEIIVGKEKKKKQEWERDNAKTYYSVLNCSWVMERWRFEVNDEDFEDMKKTSSVFLQEIISLGVFTVASAGNEKVEIDFSEKNPFPRNVKDVLLVGSSDKNNQISEFSNYGPGVIAYAPGEDIPIIGSTKREEGTSFAAPHVSGLLACLLSSELAQETPPKSAKQKRWSIDEVRTLLRKNYSCVESTHKGFPINVIFNKMQDMTELRIEKVDKTYNMSIPPFRKPTAVPLQELLNFCNSLKSDYKTCDPFLQRFFLIENGIDLCLKAVRSVTLILDGKSHTEATGGTDGLADTRVASFFGNWLPKQLTPPK